MANGMRQDMADTVVVAVGVGNTTTSAGIFVSGSLVRTARVPSRTLRAAWRLFGNAADDFRGGAVAVIVGSVVPDLASAAAEIASREFDAPARFYRKDTPVGLEVAVDEPDRVGDDRLLNALAAHARLVREAQAPSGQAAISDVPGLVPGAKGMVIVDMGTAATVDAVTADGRFLGGAILPGARTAAEALAIRTAQLPRIDIRGEFRLPGRNTEEAMRSGVLFGLAGAIDRLIEETWAALGGEVPVLGTGGEAALVAPLTRHVKEIEPALTLEGLVRAAEAARCVSAGADADKGDSSRSPLP
jgi:type III pantothenate kinase